MTTLTYNGKTKEISTGAAMAIILGSMLIIFLILFFVISTAWKLGEKESKQS